MVHDDDDNDDNHDDNKWGQLLDDTKNRRNRVSIPVTAAQCCKPIVSFAYTTAVLQYEPPLRCYLHRSLFFFFFFHIWRQSLELRVPGEGSSG